MKHRYTVLSGSGPMDTSPRKVTTLRSRLSSAVFSKCGAQRASTQRPLTSAKSSGMGLATSMFVMSGPLSQRNFRSSKETLRRLSTSFAIARTPVSARQTEQGKRISWRRRLGVLDMSAESLRPIAIFGLSQLFHGSHVCSDPQPSR